MTVGNNGIIKKSQVATEVYKTAALKEEANLAIIELKIIFEQDKTKTEANVAQYVQTEERKTQNGKIYYEDEEYYYASDNGEIVNLIEENGELKVGENINLENGSNAKYTQNIGTETPFAYTGNYQTYEVKDTGYYKMECWGAQGGDGSESFVGGKGGYSTGSVYLTEGQPIYICVGGQGTIVTSTSTVQGGYNGGGSAKAYSGSTSAATGGGCTSICTSLIGNGQLKNYEAVKTTDVLMVAAGRRRSTLY